MRKLRVLFVAGFTPIGGQGWGGQVSQANHLVHSGITQVVDFRPVDSTMRSVPPPSWLIRTTDALRRIVRFAFALPRADVALVFVSDGASLLEKGLMAGLARLLHKGVVARFSSGYLPAQCERNRWLRICLKITCRLADAVVCQSEGWRMVYQPYAGNTTSLVVIPNGVAAPKLSRTADKPAGKKIVYAGWINKAKGVLDLIEAVGILAPKHKEVSMSLAGGGMDLKALARHIEARGLGDRIRLLGWVPHDRIEEFLASGDVFALPSYGEGLPNSLLEAMCLGIPVVATRVGAIPEVVKDRESGLLVEPGNVAGLASAIEAIFADEAWARRLGAEGKKVVTAGHSMERLAALWAKTLAEAAARRGKLRPSETVYAWLR